MPTKLQQNMNYLYSKGQSINDRCHSDLRHHHIAGIFHKGRCLSWGRNVKYCYLRGFN